MLVVLRESQASDEEAMAEEFDKSPICEETRAA
jgi:hypothetical protein